MKKSIIHKPSQNTFIIKTELAPQGIIVDISDQTCQAFGNKGFKHGDKIIDKNESDNYPHIVIGIGHSTGLDGKNKRVLWFKSTHPNSYGRYFYIPLEAIERYHKIS